MNKYMIDTKDTAFICPHCGVHAQQEKYSCEVKKISDISGDNYILLTNPLKKIAPQHRTEITGKFECSMCMACGSITLWINSGYDKKLIFPTFPVEIQKPHEDMPEHIRKIYIEAAEISNQSPRSAAALLRLCLEILVNELGIKGKDLNEKIGNAEWPDEIKKACDSVRLYGNNAIHPGMIEVSDKMMTVTTLFKIINYFVAQKIHMPKIINDIYDSLPEQKKRKK